MSGWAPSPGPGGGPAGPVPGPPPGSKIKPGAGWYWLGGGLIAASVIGSVAIIVVSVVGTYNKVDDFERVDVPGGSVELDEAGDYTVYHEYPGANVTGRSSVSVTLTGPDGQDVALDRYGTNVTYDTSGHEGIALYSFEAEQAGVYQLNSPDATVGAFAVGEGLGSGIVGGAVAGIIFGVVCLVAGIVILIVTGVRRGRSKRALRPTAPPPGGWGQPPAGGWGAPPPGGAPPPPGPGGPPPPPGAPGGAPPPPAPPAPPPA